MLDGRRHCGLLQMSELGRVSMRMVYQQMLEEEDRVERGDQLDGHQFVCPQGLGADGGVTSKPLQEGLLFLAGISLEILDVVLLSLLLTRMRSTELLCLLVCPGRLHVG